MLTLDEFEEMANRLIDDIPPRLFEGLNGGIIISEDAPQDQPDLPDVYTLGEYFDDPYGLGCYIVLYYGSFQKLFADSPKSLWEEELWETIVHELRHHVEGRAGVDDLDEEDALQLEEFRLWASEARVNDAERDVFEQTLEHGDEGRNNGVYNHPDEGEEPNSSGRGDGT